MNKLIPIYDKVVIKPKEEGESLYGNIIIPDLGKEKPEMGEVIAVGEGAYTFNGTLLPTKVKPGQIVLVPKFGAQTLSVNNEDYIICKESDILAIYE